MNASVGVVMGSWSDWETMRPAVDMLSALGVPHEKRVVSAHRTPDLLSEYAKSARERGLQVIVAGAGGAAHLPGMLAAHTSVPVLGVPVRSSQLQGLDSLLSIVQMPRGVPVGTLAIGPAGALNAGLLAASIVANGDEALRERIDHWRATQTERCARRTPHLSTNRSPAQAAAHPNGAPRGGPTVSELGVFGTFLGNGGAAGDGTGAGGETGGGGGGGGTGGGSVNAPGDQPELYDSDDGGKQAGVSPGGVRLNAMAGHLLRTKFEGVDEGGVATGFAVLDSPFLVD